MTIRVDMYYVDQRSGGLYERRPVLISLSPVATDYI